MKKQTLLLLALLASSSIVVSCVDDNYDLSKDIDLTIGVGGDNLALPVGNTEPIYLRKFIKVEDSDLLDTLATGEYYLSKADLINIKEVNVSTFTVEKKSVSIDLFTIYQMPAVPVDVVIPQFEKKDIDVNNNYNIEATVPQELKEVTRLGIQNAPASVTLTFNIQGPSNAAEALLLDGLQIEFPQFIEFEAMTGLDPETNVFRFTGERVNLQSSVVYSKTFYIKSFDFSADPITMDENNRLSRSELIRVSGSTVVTNIHVNQVSGDIQLKPEVVFNTFAINSVSGTVDPKVNVDATTVSLDGLPDFLQDDDVRMDLTNPELILSINNPIDIPLLIDATLSGRRNGSSISGSNVNIPNIPIEAATQNKIVLSRLGTSQVADATHTIEVPTLNNLIRVIPDFIDIDITAKADPSKTHNIQLGKNYKIDADYGINLQFSFGKDLKIVYRDTLDGWNEDLKDLDIKALRVAVEIDNRIPLELHATTVAVDVNGHEISGLSVGIEDDKAITACTNDTQETLTSLNIVLTETTAGAMKQLDGLILRVTANATNTVNNLPLKSTHYLLLKSMKASVPGGIIYDAN